MTAVRGQEKVKKKRLDLIANTQSKLFVVAQLDDASVSVITPQLDALKKETPPLELSPRQVTDIHLNRENK